jgi:hypothetical protein
MSEPVYLSKVKVIQEKRPKRRAYIAGFKEPVYFGVHSKVADFYKMTPEEDLPATLDFLVVAAAG